MGLFKKLKVGMTLAMLASMLFTTTVYAESSYTQKENETAYYHSTDEDDRIDALKECQISIKDYLDYDVVDVDLLIYAELGWEVFDLKKTANFLNIGLEARNGYLFNEGLFATDDITNPSFIEYVCKCSKYDFEQFINTYVDDSWDYNYYDKDNIITYTITNADQTKYFIQYEENKELLIYQKNF